MRPKSKRLQYRRNYKKSTMVIKCAMGPNVLLDLAVLGRNSKFLVAAAAEFEGEEAAITTRDREVIFSMLRVISGDNSIADGISDVALSVGVLEKLSDFFCAVATSAAKRRPGAMHVLSSLCCVLSLLYKNRLL